jgi:hypothetical protein
MKHHYYSSSSDGFIVLNNISELKTFLQSTSSLTLQYL